MTNLSNKTEAFKAGGLAYLNDETFAANPFSAETVDYTDWSLGYREIERACRRTVSHTMQRATGKI